MVAAPTAFTEVIVIAPTSHGTGIMKTRFEQQRQEGLWRNRDAQLIFHVFWLLDHGPQNHLRICQLLCRNEEDVRHAIIFLKNMKMIEMEIHRKEKPVAQQPLDTGLLARSHALMVPNGPACAKWFYDDFFERGRQQYLTNEVQDLFDKRHTDMEKQIDVFWRALDFVVGNAVQGIDVTTDLHRMGVRHRNYGVKDEYYGLAGASLIAMLTWYFTQPDIPIVWGQALYETWLQAYSMVSSAMMNAETA